MPGVAPIETVPIPSEFVDGAFDLLLERLRESTGRQPMDEHRHSMMRTDSGQRVVAAGTSPLLAAVVITATSDHWELDLLVDPRRRHDRALVEAVVNRAVGELPAEPAKVQMWVHQATDAEVDAGVRAGLIERRDLHQLRVPLPVRAKADPIRTRPFAVGRDEQAWLETNAAAFADHGEQGRWTMSDLRARLAEDWFDPDDFLILEIDEGNGPRLAGFNWTKVHDGDIGEIYVIGVHPDFAGRGLGRRLCVAGLDHLARRVSTGMLYVDAGNTPAMRLYESLGFEIDHTNTALVGRPER